MDQLTPQDSLKLQVVAQRLRDIFDRDGVSPIGRGAYDYVIRSVIEALKVDFLFYQYGYSPSEALFEENDVIHWRREVDDTLKDLYSLIEQIQSVIGFPDEQA